MEAEEAYGIEMEFLATGRSLTLRTTLWPGLTSSGAGTCLTSTTLRSYQPPSLLRAARYLLCAAHYLLRAARYLLRALRCLHRLVVVLGSGSVLRVLWSCSGGAAV
eukprot:121186-Rhodomonas_salina.4